MTTATYIIWIVTVLVSFTILYKMASSRGRNPFLWGVFGAVALLIAVIVILIAGKSSDYEPQRT